MNLINKARGLLPLASTSAIMHSFSIVGFEYLESEDVFYNDVDGLLDLVELFELTTKEIISFLLYDDYNKNDKYVICDGRNLFETTNDLKYCTKMVYEKMNNEVAQIIIDDVETQTA